jgi:hypothetical protein
MKELSELKKEYKLKVKQMKDLGCEGYSFTTSDKISEKEFYEGAIIHMNASIDAVNGHYRLAMDTEL